MYGEIVGKKSGYKYFPAIRIRASEKYIIIQ